MGYDRILSSSEVAEEVLTGKMPAAVYARLAAVAASIFSSMAVRERGARRAVLEEVELALGMEVMQDSEAITFPSAKSSPIFLPVALASSK